MKQFLRIGTILSKAEQIKTIGATGGDYLAGTRYYNGQCYCDYWVDNTVGQGSQLHCNIPCHISRCQEQGTSPKIAE